MPSLTNAFINYNIPALARQGYKLWYYEKGGLPFNKNSPLGGVKAIFKSPDRSRCAVLAFYQWDGENIQEVEAAAKQSVRRMDDLLAHENYHAINCIMALVVENNVLDKNAVELYTRPYQRFGPISMGFAIIYLKAKNVYSTNFSSDFHLPWLDFNYSELTPSMINAKIQVEVEQKERIYRKTPWAVYLLMLLNIILYSYTFIPDPLQLIRMGALEGYRVWQGEYWRLFSSFGLHMGASHLVGNMIGLYLFGIKVEEYFGQARLCIIYIMAGLWGSLFSLWLHPLVPGLGASGAVFGLAGALLYIMWRHKELFKAYLSLFVVYAAIQIIIGMFSPMISTAAHVGGFVGGFLAAYMSGIIGDLVDNRMLLRVGLVMGVTVLGIAMTSLPPKTGISSICWQAHIMACQGKFENADALLQSCLAQKRLPNRKAVKHKRADIFLMWAESDFNTGNFERAIENYQKSFEIEETYSPSVYRKLSKAYEAVGDEVNAAASLLKAVNLEREIFIQMNQNSAFSFERRAR